MRDREEEGTCLCARVEPSNSIDFITPFYPLPLGMRRNIREIEKFLFISDIRNFRFIIAIVDLFWKESILVIIVLCIVRLILIINDVT